MAGRGARLVRASWLAEGLWPAGGLWLARASWPAGSAPGEHAQRIGQHGPYVPEHGRPGVTVDDAVVEGQRQRGHLAHRELSLVHPWRILDQAEREDCRLAGGQE